ncbi:MULTISPECIES: TrbC/VirB2 family protein [Agrobacterium]|jgi:type IV secretory pathway VirB2 component (pilin)|uniref:TrbC/VirB2 family protein n=2 Tax=Agrobacterium TaxID=357 RepID=A0AA44EFZ2_9HYPH|nr:MULTISPECIES: TrbC/VirB2 family protein [Agrobacterium]NTA19890.1 TrbC/VirB2 family protein [Agrobacterium tumefaciens]PZU78330.1 MAG: Type IV secretory pathway AvhB2 protein [Rhizobium sp.]MDH2092617.1 TrbC/VirB2 family protein [Agrobacterium pusense]MDX8311704.1 TrbC/VirB2 family protein [Agrobacterium sp. rho-13.3]MDX8332688.1 TrbC/VirB2 family protein [Agrobacterium rosae]
MSINGAMRFLPLMLAVVFFSAVMAEPAFAQSLGGAESILETIVDALTGNIARLIAIIACILVGFGFLFGFVDLRTVGYFIVGAIILFGAREIVDLLNSGS